VLYRVRCRVCFTVTKFNFDTVSLAKGVPTWCPFCGANDVEYTRVDNYWEDLAESLGFGVDAESVETLHKLYQLWDVEEFTRFRDFVESVK